MITIFSDASHCPRTKAAGWGAWAKANGKPDDRETFLSWVNNVYDPAAVKADFMSSWWANVLVDKILRRE